MLAGILFHFTNNLTGEVVTTSETIDWYRAGLAAIAVATVIAGVRTMAGSSHEIG